jgi:hypothetical protein
MGSCKSDVILQTDVEKNFLESRTDVISEDEFDRRNVVEEVFSLSPNAIRGNKIIQSFSGKSTGMLDYSFLSSVGPTEQVPVTSFETAVDDEVTACKLQGMMFHDDELGWCTVTNWGVEYGTTILFYSPVALSNPVEEEHHASLAEVLTWIRDSPVMPLLSAYRSSRRLAGFSCKKHGTICLLAGKSYSPV